MSGIYKIEIEDWHPAKVNSWDGRHWRVKHRIKKSDREMIFWYSRHIPPATSKRTVTLEIVLGKGERGGDPDSYWKSLLDALKASLAIKDDSKEWVELMPVTYSRGQKKTIITLEE